MDITRTDVDELNAQLTIKLDPKDYQERVGSILSDYRKENEYARFPTRQGAYGHGEKDVRKGCLGRGVEQGVF